MYLTYFGQRTSTIIVFNVENELSNAKNSWRYFVQLQFIYKQILVRFQVNYISYVHFMGVFISNNVSYDVFLSQ